MSFLTAVLRFQLQANTARRTEFRSVEACEVSQWPRLHRRRDRLPPRVPDQGRMPSQRLETAHRRSQGLSVPRHPASEVELVISGLQTATKPLRSKTIEVARNYPGNPDRNCIDRNGSPRSQVPSARRWDITL